MAVSLPLEIIMSTKLYVGNLAFQTTEDQLKQLFAEFGGVAEASLVTDRVTGRSRGFAFVTMESPEAAAKAIQGLHGRNVEGRDLTVNEARPRPTDRKPGRP